MDQVPCAEERLPPIGSRNEGATISTGAGLVALCDHRAAHAQLADGACTHLQQQRRGAVPAAAREHPELDAADGAVDAAARGRSGAVADEAEPVLGADQQLHQQHATAPPALRQHPRQRLAPGENAAHAGHRPWIHRLERGRHETQHGGSVRTNRLLVRGAAHTDRSTKGEGNIQLPQGAGRPEHGRVGEHAVLSAQRRRHMGVAPQLVQSHLVRDFYTLRRAGRTTSEHVAHCLAQWAPAMCSHERGQGRAAAEKRWREREEVGAHPTCL
mmetsp:Transcript_73297/g.238506  ORF Transcript_73297/g.238506 Transcript_73297/m.238506 type:complete len:271 (-) Transcript_73297:497-1309(-)